MSQSGLEHRPVAMAFPRVFSLPNPVLVISFLAGYVLLDWISFIQPFAPFGITPWNPPTGLSFVLVLLFGQRFIPLLFIAPLLADLLVRQLPLPWWVEITTSLIIGGGYTLGLMVLTRPATRFNPALASLRDLVILFVVAIVSAAAVAILYVGLLVGSDWLPSQNFAAAALQFWIGDIIGVAVVAPFVLIYLTRGRALRVTAETVIQLLAILVALGLVLISAEKHRFEFFYILFLPITWMAVRGGLELVTVGISITQVGLILIAQLLPHAELDVAGFQALMLVLAVTGLAAGAAVTEHRRNELQLRRHQDSLARVARLGSMGEFAAMIAHEINQPLMAAGTYARLTADMLHSGEMKGGTAVETAEKAATQVKRAADVLRQLRALIRLDQSGRAPIGVARIIHETLDICRPDLERYGVTARVSLGTDLPPVMVDLLQIEQVLLNILRNATEAMSEVRRNRIVTIRASLADSHQIEFEIRDTGPGFPAELVNVESAPLSSTKAEGLGVGLSLCRSIVESHGGQLTIGGGADGAVVRFTLPAAGRR